MEINIDALENRVARDDGGVVARCPACALTGHDNRGEHLIVYPDGKFGCVAHPQDREHNREILRLVGQEGGRRTYTIDIKPLVIPPSSVLMRIGVLNAKKQVTALDTLSAPESMPAIKGPIADIYTKTSLRDGAESENCLVDTGAGACVTTSTVCLV